VLVVSALFDAKVYHVDAQGNVAATYDLTHGDSDPTAPTTVYDWDWNICHTYYLVKSGQGNVPFRGKFPSSLWDGDNPPADSAPPCGTDLFTGARRLLGSDTAKYRQYLPNTLRGRRFENDIRDSRKSSISSQRTAGPGGDWPSGSGVAGSEL
jgi:hypothetical protein